jgi:DNA topoisomerase IA
MKASESSTVAVLPEKLSVARDIARVLGADKRGEGYLQGNGYVVTRAIGHLVQLLVHPMRTPVGVKSVVGSARVRAPRMDLVGVLLRRLWWSCAGGTSLLAGKIAVLEGTSVWRE